jgi:hypothetical protein
MTTAIVVLGPGWRKAYQAWLLEEEKLREVYQAWRLEEEKRREAYQAKRIAFEKSYKDDISIPIRYRIVSWFRKRRALKHVDADERLEHDSSDQ